MLRDQCTKCGLPWRGIPLDHITIFHCEWCGYTARETDGGLADYSRVAPDPRKDAPTWP